MKDLKILGCNEKGIKLIGLNQRGILWICGGLFTFILGIVFFPIWLFTAFCFYKAYQDQKKIKRLMNG